MKRPRIFDFTIPISQSFYSKLLNSNSYYIDGRHTLTHLILSVEQLFEILALGNIKHMCIWIEPNTNLLLSMVVSHNDTQDIKNNLTKEFLLPLQVWYLPRCIITNLLSILL